MRSGTALAMNMALAISTARRAMASRNFYQLTKASSTSIQAHIDAFTTHLLLNVEDAGRVTQSGFVIVGSVAWKVLEG